MQTDKDITIYIGVTDNCDEAIVNEINKCCQLLTSKNANGGQLLLVTESNIDYPQADYLINMFEGDVFITRNDKAFYVKLDCNNSISDVLHALTASWFLANLVGHDYADYVNCLSISKSLQLNIVEVDHAKELASLLLERSEDNLPTAMTCYIETVEKYKTYTWFEELGTVLQQYATEDAYCVVTMATKSIQQKKSKIYLTRFYQ